MTESRRRKHQAPSSQLQRNIKSQAPTGSHAVSLCCLALGACLELEAWMLVPRETASLMHDGSRCLHQRPDIGARADRDSQATPQHWVIEPPHQYLSLPQFLQPGGGGKPRRPDQDEVRLAWENFETDFGQGSTEQLPRFDNPSEVGPIKRQSVQRRQRGDLAQAVDIIAVADLVQGGDEFVPADTIADALEAK